jgi:hypothetical protein
LPPIDIHTPQQEEAYEEGEEEDVFADEFGAEEMEEEDAGVTDEDFNVRVFFVGSVVVIVVLLSEARCM